MKKLAIPITVLLVAAFIITGCSTATTTSNQPTTSIPATTPAATTPYTTTTSAPSPTTSATATSPSPSATANAPQYGGTLKWIQSIGPTTPIGWVAEAGGPSLTTMQLSIEEMLSGQLDGSLQPMLATSYDVNSDPNNPSVTFHLRQGVKFSDGTDWNAQAAKWNYEQTAAGPTNKGTAAYWKSFDVIDDYTLRVNLTTWQNRILTAFAMPSSMMVSPTAYEKNGVDWMRTHMVGTGPFVQTNYQRDVSTTFVKNTNYWQQGKPYLDGFQDIYVTDELTREALFQSGGGQLLDLAGNGRIANELKADGYDIASETGGTNVLVPDSKNADSPWSNQLVREAAEYAINKDELTKTFGYGYWTTAYQIISPSNPYYDPNFSGERQYDPAKAKELLTQAGYPNGFKTTIYAQNNANQNIILALQAYLKAVGIDATPDFVEPSKFSTYSLGTWNNGLLYFYIFEWPNYNYGFNLWFGIPTSWLQSLAKPPGWKEALDASLATETPDKATIQNLAKMFYDYDTVITLNYPSALTAMTSNVHGTGIYSRIQNYFFNPENAWLSK